MLYTQELSLHHSATEAGDDSEHNGAWLDVREFDAGVIWIDLIAIDSGATASFTVDYANVDKTIIGPHKVAIDAMTAVGQQGPVALSTPIPAFVRINWTVTATKNATFRVVADMRGRNG